MPEQRWVFCEKTGRWAAVFRAVLDRAGQARLARRICETRSFDECRERLVEWPASLVCLEVTSGNILSSLRWLVRCGRSFPRARAVALCDMGLPEIGWALREAGAAAVIENVWQLQPAVDLAVRTLGNESELAESPGGLALWDSIAGMLPWGESAVEYVALRNQRSISDESSGSGSGKNR